MPRQARLDVPGALHHIMVRGNNRAKIFSDDQDRTRFLDRLGKTVEEAQCSVYAWVLMDNHIHLLFRSGEKGISAVMRKVLTWYALYHNRRHQRTGHLFENRYKSILCEEDRYLLALIQYIHLNPVRAGIVKTIEELDRYPWSGHKAVMGRSGYAWMDTDYVLLQFNETKRRARNAYRKFVEEGFQMGRKPEMTGGGLVRSKGGWSQVLSARRRGQQEEYDERILGSGDFVNAILREVEDKQLRQLKLKRAGRTIGTIIAEECKKRKISASELKAGIRRQKVSEARATIAFLGREELGLSAAEMARHLGVNTSSIVRALERVEQQAERGKA
jgi:REP element-mobilizing transposase RayT